MVKQWLNEIKERLDRGEDIPSSEVRRLLTFTEETVKAINQLGQQVESCNSEPQEPKQVIVTGGRVSPEIIQKMGKIPPGILTMEQALEQAQKKTQEAKETGGTG